MLSIGLRIPEEDRELLRKVVKLRGENASNFIRRAIRKELVSLGYYSKEERRALGL